MKKIEMERFDTLPTYSKVNTDGDNTNTINYNQYMNGKQHSYMPSSAFGRDTILPLHIDEDYFLSIISIHSQFDLNKGKNLKHSKVLRYFNFDNGLSVAIRNGDILIFNPSIKHCISSNNDGLNPFESVYCVSQYFKTLLSSRNNNSLMFNEK